MDIWSYMRTFISSLITMMKTAKFPGVGISYWTLYTGLFFVTCMALLLKQLIGLGGGLPSGGTLSHGAGSVYRIAKNGVHE